MTYITKGKKPINPYINYDQAILLCSMKGFCPKSILTI